MCSNQLNTRLVVANKLDLVASSPPTISPPPTVEPSSSTSLPTPDINSETISTSPDANLKPRAISLQQGQSFAKENGLLYVETSAKEGWGIVEAFERTAKEVLKRHGEEELRRRGKKVSVWSLFLLVSSQFPASLDLESVLVLRACAQ
jgi:hypothetical protein